MFSIIVSVYNEEDAISVFTERLLNVIKSLNYTFEVIFVNDGSTDNSMKELKRIANNHNELVKVISLSRNFGHEAAMIAGIDMSTGKAVICMDCDLQHPPEYLEAMILKWHEGYEIVMMIRSERSDEGLFRKVLGALFYNLLTSISDYRILKNASDFFLIDKKIKYYLTTNYRENVRFLRGYIQNIGFNLTTMNYICPDRIAGQSKYSLSSLFKLSFHAISAFSTFPLQLGLMISIFVGLFSLSALLYSIILYFYGDPVSGYTTIVVLISLYFSILFFLIGLIGNYIAILFEEIKRRPIYVIDKLFNFKDEN